MRGHLPAPHHDGMDAAPALYMIRINGLPDRPALHANHQDQVTAAHRDGRYRRARRFRYEKEPPP